jgi:hypothetical protein
MSIRVRLSADSAAAVLAGQHLVVLFGGDTKAAADCAGSNFPGIISSQSARRADLGFSEGVPFRYGATRTMPAP